MAANRAEIMPHVVMPADVDDEVLDGDAELDVPEVEVPPDVELRVTRYISPDASELMNKRPWLSNAIATGRKQSFGQTLLSSFVMTSVAAVKESEASTGVPSSLNWMTDNL